MALVLPLLSVIVVFLLIYHFNPDLVDKWRKSNLNPLKDVRHYIIFLLLLGLVILALFYLNLI